MGVAGTVFVVVFYVAMFAALAYFLHRVAWLVRFRRLQAQLVGRALAKLREQKDTAVIRWDKGADASWAKEAGLSDDAGPTAYVQRIEDELEGVYASLEESHRDISEALVRVLSGHKPQEGAYQTPVLRIPRREGPAHRIVIDLNLPRVRFPDKPERKLFELEVRSRYGVVRRALAFLLGAADVVYSTGHVARMSQNERVPWGVLIRRLSLVVLILGVLVIDITFQARARLVASAETHLGGTSLGLGGTIGEWLDDKLPVIVALGGWLAVYGAIYLGMYLYLRRRSQLHLRRLKELRDNADAEVEAITQAHLADLVLWGRDYATTLDGATDIVMRQARMLITRTTHRMRRRVASGQLSSLAERAAQAFFQRLPEASTALQDAVTKQKHSLRHELWPRESEMGVHVEIAQFRACWRDLELSLGELRTDRPDPELAAELWRKMALYARMFPAVLPDGYGDELNAAHEETMSRIVAETEDDVRELYARLGDLASWLQKTMDASGPLVESRVELTEQSIQGDVARFAQEALQVRERARLEAMAFEI